MTRRLASLFIAATAFLIVTSLADITTGFARQLEQLAPQPGHERPEPVSLLQAETPDSQAGTQHSILFEETASQIPALDVQPQTATTNQFSTAGSPVADDPFVSASGIRRVSGTGEEAMGTFATSDNMPIASQNSNPRRTFNDEGQYDSRRQRYQTPATNQTPNLPPISSNGLRGSSLTPQTNGSSPAMPSTRFGDRETWDQQPQPPQRQSNRNLSQSFGPDRGVTQQQPISSGFDNQRFNGPLNSAPPIHSAPAEQSVDDRLNTMPPRSDAQKIYDSNIAPIQYQQSANNKPNRQASPTTKVDLSLARKIMSRYEIDRAPDPLPGRPAKLVEVLKSTPPHLQKRVINQYWKTFFDWATVLNSAQHADWLYKLPSPQNRNETGLLDAARAAARNQLLADEIQLGNSQCQLQQLMGTDDDLLPLPSDQPLLKTYNTHYDWYESRNRLPEDLRGIDVMLSKSIQLISNRAATVGTTRVALSQIRNAYNQNPRELGSILEAARLWNEAEQDLVSSIVTYNQAIADYSLTISPGNSQPQQIVAMLISKPKPAIAQQNPMPSAGRTGRAANQNNSAGRNSGQSRFQNASQPRTPNNRYPMAGQSGGIYDRADDPISSTMNPGSSLSPKGYSNNRPPNQPSGGRQPARSPSQPGTFQVPRSPTNQGQPNRFQPTPNRPLANPGDRNAFLGNNRQSRDGGSPSSFSPPNTRGASESAKEYNSFGN